MKRCPTCKIEKAFSEFYRNRSRPKGVSSQCKLCSAAAYKTYYNSHQKERCLVSKRWRMENRERWRANKRAWDRKQRASNPEYVLNKRAKAQKAYAANPELARLKGREQYRKARLARPEYYAEKDRLKNTRRREYHTTYVRERRRNDLDFRLRSVLRCNINNSIRSQAGYKHAKSETLLGCSIPDFKIYIESKFEPGMTWNNIHLDHIMPCAIFDLSKPEHQRRCFHFSNYQPLFAADNIRKRDKVVDPQFKLL